MGATTGVEWTATILPDGTIRPGKTWNPWQGCNPVSPGCAHCYMYTEKRRYGQDPTRVVRSKDATFYAPLKWQDPGNVFTCSWSDFFHEAADPWRAEAWAIIRATRHLHYQVLTKRIERVLACLPPDWGDGYPNVTLMTSVENQHWADVRIPQLLRIPARVRGLSCEPLLGSLHLDAYLGGHDDQPRVDWVIIGGESGPQARPMEVAWARSLITHCHEAGVAVFMKQLGERLARTWGCRDRKGGDPAEWPADLRVREFPQEVAVAA